MCILTGPMRSFTAAALRLVEGYKLPTGMKMMYTPASDRAFVNGTVGPYPPAHVQ
jgi:hypothetical protein